MTMNQPGRIYKTPVPVSDDPAAPLTMSSRQIAELLESRHDKVKQSMDRLAEKGVITFAPLGEKSFGGRPGTVYRINKRDSFVVVAQLSPEFTARLVDRWQELEDHGSKPAVLTGQQLMAAALIEADATLKAQARQMEILEGVAKAHDRLTEATGSLCITDAAKALGIRPGTLFDWLSAHGWTYRRDGDWVGYETKCASGLLEHRVSTFLRSDGYEAISKQVRITAKGMSRLAQLISPTAQVLK